MAFRIPLPNFGRIWQRRQMRLTSAFRYGTLPQYDNYLERHPDMIGGPSERISLSDWEIEMLTGLHQVARLRYRRDPAGNDFWDDTLPGDCENQCLWTLRKCVNYTPYPELAQSLRLVLCSTETRENHVLLCVCCQDTKGVPYERLIDFRLTEALLPPKHKAFDDYKWIAMHVPGSNVWNTAHRVDAKETANV